METPSDGLLTPRQIVLLSKAISCRDMKVITERYLDISREEVFSLVDANRDDTEVITREIIRKWVYKHSDQNQIKVSASYPKAPVAGLGCQSSRG